MAEQKYQMNIGNKSDFSFHKKNREESYGEIHMDFVKIKKCEPDFCICLNEWRVKIREAFIKKKVRRCYVSENTKRSE